MGDLRLEMGDGRFEMGDLRYANASSLGEEDSLLGMKIKKVAQTPQQNLYEMASMRLQHRNLDIFDLKKTK